MALRSGKVKRKRRKLQMELRKHWPPPRWRGRFRRVRLFIVHSHFRPGGVRRVIELGVSHLVALREGDVAEVTLVGGERPDANWWNGFRQISAPASARCRIEPALGYLSEQRAKPSAIRSRVRRYLRRVLGQTPVRETAVWAHNLGLGRNPILAEELVGLCTDRGLRLVLHHHDWWFDNRWARWPEMRRAGLRSLRRVAQALIPVGGQVHHVAINRADAAVLRKHLGAHARWIPNPAETGGPPRLRPGRSARRWLRSHLGVEGPVWLMPCRLLRRKNVAEALLLMRWLRPEAWLVTTGGPSSAEETSYARQLAAAARRYAWPLRLSVLQRGGPDQPTVAALMQSSEVVLLTSLQEGFGLPYLEATTAQRPLIARRLPNVAPDLARLGFRFPQVYDEIWIDPQLFDWEAERSRRRAAYAAWRKTLPAFVRAQVGAARGHGEDIRPCPLAFSRLSLAAQIEVLRHPVAWSWQLCAPLNPFLRTWRRLAAARRLQPAVWPARAEARLGATAYARHLSQVLRTRERPAPDRRAAVRCLEDFLRLKLSAENLYPMLWNPRG